MMLWGMESYTYRFWGIYSSDVACRRVSLPSTPQLPPLPFFRPPAPAIDPKASFHAGRVPRASFLY